MINVLYAEEYPRPDFNQITNTTIRLLDEYNITFEGRNRIFVDEQQITFYKHKYPSVYDLQFLQQNMFVIPVPFAKYHKEMLAHFEEMLEYRNGQIAINPRFTKLITALRTAVEKGEGTLDKEATSHDDLFDAFRMSLQYWVSN